MIYEYKCLECGQVQEVWAKLSDPPPAECPACHSARLEKIISATAFALKGSGWYSTDYKKTTPKSSTSSAAEGEGAGCGAPACGTGGCASGGTQTSG